MNHSQLQPLISPIPNSATLAARYADALDSAFARYEINTPLRQAHFLGQVLHETGQFRWPSEIWGPTEQQKKYDPPHRLAEKLGNTQPGDGYTFRGAGLFHLTGRYNIGDYLEAVNRLRDEPYSIDEILTLLREDPYYQADSAGWYWADRGLNSLADADDCPRITKEINGAYTHLEQRATFVERAKRVLAA